MSARPGFIGRLVARARGGLLARNDPEAPAPPPPSEAEALVAAYLAKATAAVQAGRGQSWLMEPERFPSGMDASTDPALQIACLRAAMDRLAANPCMPDDRREIHLLWLLISHLDYRRLPYTREDVVHLLDRSATAVAAGPVRGIESLTMQELLAVISKWSREHGIGAEGRAAAGRLRKAVLAATDGAPVWQARREEILDLLVDLLDDGGPEGLLSDRDVWGHLVREALTRMLPSERAAWRWVLEQAAAATGARPTGSWRERANKAVAVVGEDAFARAVVPWFEWYVAPPRGAGGGVDTELPKLSGTAERNITVLRGLVWCCAEQGDPRLARAVADATEASFKKVPGVGPRSVRIGNAGIYALGAMPGMHGLAQLARLRQRVVYAQARKAIDGALNAAAARLQLAREDLDDLATLTFDLVDGRRRFDFPPFAAELAIGGTAGAEVRWFGAGGAARRTEPAEVKRRHPEERATLKRTADDLRKTLLAQRDRLERLLLSERSWPLAVWHARYLDHPLLADLTRRLIWTFEGDGRDLLGTWRDGAIVDAADRPLAPLPEETRVCLWHPVRTDGDTIAAWQAWLDRHEVRQPFKQAYREIYVLTDAERTTATYSNRFASHILRQHQFRALAQARGWTYRLQGGFDDWSTPTLELPGWRLAVEFLVEGIETDDAMPNAGVYPFVATDQVRFRRYEGRQDWYDRHGEVVPLAEIPPLVFTEVMRDVDLFVGVASVGTDPTWHDRGPQRIREYWDRFAFGELTSSAQTRRVVLERLVPRLAIASRCELEDRCLVVRGDLRTYRIHLGSGNILMEPNNQYLCIVPKAEGNDAGPDLFLPFEGDALLTTILSKALLLADDRAITDPTITRQISRQSTR